MGRLGTFGVSAPLLAFGLAAAKEVRVLTDAPTGAANSANSIGSEEDMFDCPVRNKDLQNDKKISDLMKQMKKKPDKDVAKLIEEMCPGKIDIEGDEPVYLVNTVWNLGDDHAGEVKVEKGKVAPYMSGRTYFGEACKTGQYNHNDYVAMNLLGKAFEFTVDLTDAGCGCNAALYLTNLRQNSNISECQDFYCDANNVCGVSCAEVDIMEANQHAWHSTLHTATDRDGAAVGYGGGGPGWNGPRDWTEKDYGTGGKCIDTEKPFRASISFPVDPNGVLTAMDVKLTQDGKKCPMELSLHEYEGMNEMTQALKSGMTPIISYWAADDMTWMDGAGDDMQGPCIKDNAKKCGDKVLMYDFAIKNLKKSYKSPHLRTPKTTTPPPDVQAAIKAELAEELAAQEKKNNADWQNDGNEQQGDQQDWNQQNDWDQQQQQNDWDQQGQQQNSWDQQSQQQNDNSDWNQQNQQQESNWDQSGSEDWNGGSDAGSDNDDWGQPWASWDHSTPKPGQAWDGAGRPIGQDGKQTTKTTTTPCEDGHSDPVHCKPKLPGDPLRGGLTSDEDVDYLFKKNEDLGPILQSSSGVSGVTASLLFAGAVALLAVFVGVAVRRPRGSAVQSQSAIPESSQRLPSHSMRGAASSQNLLTMGSPEVV